MQLPRARRSGGAITNGRSAAVTHFNLDGRTAVVTGGNRGIGLGIARGLAGAGASILVVGRDAARNADAVETIRRETGAAVGALAADVTREADAQAAIAATVAQFGTVDILVNCAGTNDRKAPDQYSLAEWNDLIAVNLTSVFLMSVAAYPVMKQRQRGKIINIGSMFSLFGSGFAAPYAAAKAGVVQLTKSLGVSWGPDGIQVNAILPGWIDTELTREARRQVPALDARVVARTPVGRWGESSEIAGTAVYLASPASDFVTGAALPVDGGYSANG